MNKKAFTLVELIAVIVLISIITLLVVPNVRNLLTENSEKEYEEYLNLMVEYTKVMPIYQTNLDEEKIVCLEDLNMKKINDTMNCSGYTLINGKQITPHLLCKDSNEKTTFSTDGFDSNNCS